MTSIDWLISISRLTTLHLVSWVCIEISNLNYPSRQASMPSLFSYSIVTTEAFYLSSQCGYCKGQPKEGQEVSIPNNQIAMFLHKCTSGKYESLMNLGFRRSGNYLYRDDSLRTCCQHHTIRTSIDSYKPLKEHKKCINRFANSYDIKLNNPKNRFDFVESILNCHRNAESSRFRTKLEPAGYTEEKFNLFKKYQTDVHNEAPEEVTKKGFDRFLCANPFPDEYDANELENLNTWWQKDAIHTDITGAFHELYYLDNELVAISVIDILPNSISSVYFLWDPKCARLSLGTFSALKDIVLAHKLGKKHYYLGYYIPTCPKMVYKRKFGGELLDRVNHKFISLEYLEERKLLHPCKPYVFEEVKDGEQATVLDREIWPTTDISVYPESWVVKEGYHLVNIAEQIYRKNQAPEASKLFPNLRLLKEGPSPTVYDLSTSTESLDSSLFPSMILGAIPLWKLREILDSTDTKKLEDKTLFLINQGSSMIQLPYSMAMTKEFSAYYINLIRVWGLEIADDCAIIHTD